VCEEGLHNIYEEMCKNLVIYEEAVSHMTRSLLNFLIYEESVLFFFKGRWKREIMGVRKEPNVR
jgi:hypothetical protein